MDCKILQKIKPPKKIKKSYAFHGKSATATEWYVLETLSHNNNCEMYISPHPTNEKDFKITSLMSICLIHHKISS